MKLLPQEIEVRYILPTIRKEFAIALAERKLNQKEIASLLDVTPAAVSQYLSNKRAANIELANTKEIQNSINKLLEKKSDAYSEMYSLSKKFVNDKTICKIHRLYDKNVSKECNICLNN